MEDRVEYTEKEDLPPGIHTTTCRECNRTCHKNCTRKNDEDKKKCVVMNKETLHCTRCPKKCIWSEHSNVPYLLHVKVRLEKKTKEQLKAQYVKSQETQNEIGLILKGLAEEIISVTQEILKKRHLIQECIEQLQNIALRPESYAQKKNLINEQIKVEMSKKQAGWQERVADLVDQKEQMLICETLFKADRQN